MATGERTVFDCHEWVDGRCGWQRVLTATLTLPSSLTLATLVNMGQHAVLDQQQGYYGSRSPGAAAAAAGGWDVGGQAPSTQELQQAAAMAAMAAARARAPSPVVPPSSSPAAAAAGGSRSPKGGRTRAGQVPGQTSVLTAGAAKGAGPGQQHHSWQNATY